MKNKPTIAIPPQGCESYLTAGKEYEIIEIIETEGCCLFHIKPDIGVVDITCSSTESAHLNGKDWILK